ncbi:MAG TPA: RRQRL motif-containing zinc-binding protein [Streptosporangiaceae bacterium]
MRARPRVVLADLDADPPVYRWRHAPPHLRTRAQLHAAGLTPAAPPAAMLAWASRRGGRPRTSEGWRYAWLYDTGHARPRRPATPAQIAALRRALAARRTCPVCGYDRGYIPSARLGCCNDCADRHVA